MNEEKLNTLNDALKLLSGSVSKTDFVNAFKTVLKIVKDMKDNNASEWETVRATMSSFSDKLTKDTSSSLTDIKGKVNHLFVKERLDSIEQASATALKDIKNEVSKALKQVDAKMKTIKNGKDGYTPIKGRDYFDGKDGKTPVKGTDYFDGKDGLKGDTYVPRSNNSMRFYDLTAQTNGTLKVFTVPKGLAGVVFCSDYPLVLMEGNGFTLNKTRTQLTLTFPTAPSTGAQLLYQYVSQFNLA